MRRPLGHVALMAATFLSAGCTGANLRPIDAVGDNPVFLPKDGFSARLPPGWALLAPENGRLRAVNGGADLSMISFELLRPEQVDYQAFRNLESLSPRQAAERYLAAPARDVEALSSSVVSIAPATLGGCAGFRLDYVQLVWGLRYRRLVYGWVTTRGLYTVTFQAPLLQFFDRDLPIAEAVARSVTPPPRKGPIRCVSPTT